jgi:hypothetical protein
MYLDVEAGTALTADYWAGRASTVFTATDPSGAEPFYPCIYTQFVRNASNGLYYPQSSVQSALNAACSQYPNDVVMMCFGFWSNEPEPYSYCASSATPDWSVFGSFTQHLCGGNSTSVPVLLYQYAENCGCIPNGYPGFAGDSNVSNTTACYINDAWYYYPNNNLDLDGNDNTGADQYMLMIV